MELHTCLEDSISRPKATTPSGETIGANVPYSGAGLEYKIPWDSVIIYSIPNSFKYLSTSGTYPHSGSQIPLGFLPRYFSYVWTPTAIWALTVFSFTYNFYFFSKC